METKQYISVILPLKIEWEPCYLTQEDVEVGDRVRVNFAGREYVGAVSRTDVTPDIEPSKVRKIVKVESGLEKVLPQEIDLWRKVADYYMCCIGEVYRAAYPASKVNMEQARAEAMRKVISRRTRTLEAIEVRLTRLRERLDRKNAQILKSREGTKVRATCMEDIGRIQDDIRRTELAAEAAKNHLEAAHKGLIVDTPLPEDKVNLSEEQERAAREIREAFKTGKPVLLHGVTGSGKTEIYIRLALEAIRQGRNVLYLVPEIALSRQLEERLYEHFGEFLLTFHSGESPSSRRNSAETIRNGNYIALCTRSGLFLPHHDLGLIIVDEEHDSSYKQDSPAPRYNGRDTALILNTIHKGCNILLGSATPSLEELYNTCTGRHVKVELMKRFHGSEDSEIEFIDTRAERRKNGMAGNFSRKLIDRIRETLAAGEQVLILRSRRAWSSALQCSECGEIVRCPHCNVSLSYHKTEDRMVCHSCGYKAAFTGNCAKCSGPLHHLGAGTQKIEEETALLFPEAKIARLDSDSARDKAYEAKVIKDFAKGETDILIGTQIITKGFDFSNLTLVAIIAADTLLGIQDFRADEKALQIMEQFRGRCGRRGLPGRLVIQTSQPEHPVYMQLTGSDKGPAESLMAERRDFGFPPYTRIVELSFRDIFEDRVERMSSAFSAALERAYESTLPDSISLTPPYRPPVDRISDQHIRKIRVCLKKDRHLSANKKILKNAVSDFEKQRKYEGHITIDVDPS